MADSGLYKGHWFVAAAAALGAAALGVLCAWGLNVYVAVRLSTDVAVGDATAEACTSGYVERESAAGRVLRTMDGSTCEYLHAAASTLAFSQAVALLVVGALVLGVRQKVGDNWLTAAGAVAVLAVVAMQLAGGSAQLSTELVSRCRALTQAEIGIETSSIVTSALATAGAWALLQRVKGMDGGDVKILSYLKFNASRLILAGAAIATVALVSRVITFPLSRRLRQATGDYVRLLEATAPAESCAARRNVMATYACTGNLDSRLEKAACDAAMAAKKSSAKDCKPSADAEIGNTHYALHQPGLEPYGGGAGELRTLRRSRHLPEAAASFATGVGATLAILAFAGVLAAGAAAAFAK